MPILRESFAGINARFHLVGIYTLVDILVRILVSQATAHPDEWGAFIVPGLLLALGVTFGIVGVVVHAAAGKGERPSFLQVAGFLFLPLLWLQTKISLIAYGPAFAALLGWHSLFAAAVPLETWVKMPAFHTEPIVETLSLLLFVYATPYAVRQRATGRRGAPIREGLALLFGRGAGGARLLVILLPAIGLSVTAHYLRGPEVTDQVPGVPEGLALLVISYLTLVAVFGAARLLARRAAAAAEELRRDDPGGFGNAAGTGA